MRHIYSIVIILAFSLKLSATDKLTVKYLGIENGLSNNAVTCIFQDHNGFMWFGTYDGLNKYDGYSFKVYKNIIGDSTSLSDNHVFCINADKNKNIWVGSLKGISIFNPVQSSFRQAYFTPLAATKVIPLKASINAIKNIQDYMFAATNQYGLVIFKKGSITGQQLKVKGLGNQYTVTSVEYDPASQSVWFFVNEAGLYYYNLNNGEVKAATNILKQATCIRLKDKDNVWIGTDNGLFSYNRLHQTVSGSYISTRTRVTNIIKDRQGQWWISSDGNGVSVLQPHEMQAKPLGTYSNVNINSNAIYDIYEDTDGRKWIGTLRGGINIVIKETSAFKKIIDTGSEAAVSNFILSFCEDDISNIWIGTDGGGLKYWNRGSNTYTSYTHTPAAHSITSNFITNITKDFKNDIWVSTWFGGINKLNRNNNNFKYYSCFNPVTRQVENNIWFIYEDRKQKLWASATNNGCLYVYNRAKDSFIIFDPQLSNFQCIAEDRSGNMWGGTYSALIFIDSTQKNHRTYNIGYPVRSIHENSAGNLWVGTEGGGLLLFDKKKGVIKSITTRDGLPGNTVLRILEDQKGNLWLSTFNGLCRYSPSANAFKNFSPTDGLQSSQFSFNAALKLSSGEFAFGGIKGFNIFFPDSVYDKKNIPPLFLTGIRVSNKPIEENNNYITATRLDQITGISVPHEKGILSIDFTAIEYSGADKMRYAYLLKGWDADWNMVNNTRTANYSRLHEGSYTFLVKAMSADGVWGKETALLSIKILPPWYRTWWAYITYLLIGAGLIYLYLLYNKRQVRLRYEIQLANIEKDKEKELTEKKIAFFTHISHEFRTPLTLIINPLKELMTDATDASAKKIKLIQRNAKRLLSLVDQLLIFRKVESIDQHLKLEKFNLKDTCNEVFLSFLPLTTSKKIDFNIHLPDSITDVYGDKEKIEIILFNLLSNAIKFTPANGTVALAIDETEKTYEISVADTGAGIPATVGNKLFESFYQAGNNDKASQTGFGIGMYVSRKLAKAHFGNLTYTSNEGTGSTFVLQLQKGKKHFGTQPISEEHSVNSGIVQELVIDDPDEVSYTEKNIADNSSKIIDKLASGLPTMVVVDDNDELRKYIREIFTGQFTIYEADDGLPAFEIIKTEMPDIVISDVKMKQMNGIELCSKIKAESTLAHIPVVLLTANASEDARLKGIEGGAEDYISKPFEKEIIIARVQTILKGRDRLRQYFFNTITLQPATGADAEHKAFIEKCIEIIEAHLDNPAFTVQVFCREIGMSHPSLYKKIKAVSGLTVNVFVRYLRLRKAAELLINTNKTIVEITYITGFNDIKYFREQFHKLFEMNPSEFVKKYRKPLGRQQKN